MGPHLLAAVCEALADHGPAPAAMERIRQLLGLELLEFHPGAPSLSAPTEREMTLWVYEVQWRGRCVGTLAGRGDHDAQVTASLLPLLAQTLAAQRELQRMEARVTSVEGMASRALELAELVTWLLHARDHAEVEKLGCAAVASMLGVRAGAVLTRGSDDRWTLRVPSRGLTARELQLCTERYGPIVAHELDELELRPTTTGDPLERALVDWGYDYAFAVPLDANQSPRGLLLALASEEQELPPEARVAAGQLSVMMAVALDRLDDQRRVVESRRVLGDALRAASMGTMELDLRTQQVTWSAELHQLMGGEFTERVLSREDVRAMAAPEDVAVQQDALRLLLATGQTTPVVTRYGRLDGTMMWARSLYQLVTDEHGEACRVRAVLRDVTAEVESQQDRERALTRAMKYERLFTLSETLAAVCDPTGCIDEASPSWARQLGWSPELLRGQSLVALAHPDEQAAIKGRLHEHFLSGVPPSAAINRLRARDGSWHWVSWTAAAENGHYFAAATDVTPLLEAREQALSASRLKSRILANTSHEVRTPLNGILGMTQLALQTELTAEQRDYLEAVHGSGENLLAIVNDILDISKIESGHLVLDHLPFSLPERLYEATRTQASRAHSRGIELVVDVAPNVPEHVLGDRLRLGQILTNLVGNAIKFTERGSVTVSAAFEDGEVHLEVQDTGIGIPRDRREAIFEAFTQADGSTSRRFGGTGLGLTITLELVRAMGGRIEVDSTPGLGSTFHVWLELPPQPAAPRVAGRFAGLRVLLVCGTEVAERVTARQLEQLGCEVKVARPEEAMRRLLEAEARPFDLLLADATLSGTTGTELAEAVDFQVELSRLPRALIVRTTDRPADAELARARIERVLTRPVSLADLEATLSELRPEGGFRAPAMQQPLPAPRRALQVLLAEDNAINARLARRLIEKLGHHVHHVSDGVQAAEAALRGNWDAVLMDMQMPVLDGLDATRRIREAEVTTGGHLPIIALTANAMKGDEQVCLDAGMDAYLTKPIDLDRLSEMLERYAGELREKTG